MAGLSGDEEQYFIAKNRAAMGKREGTSTPSETAFPMLKLQEAFKLHNKTRSSGLSPSLEKWVRKQVSGHRKHGVFN